MRTPWIRCGRYIRNDGWTLCLVATDPLNPIYTIGHSDHPIEALIALLQGAGANLLVDVRAQPYSRRHPQYRREALADALGRAAIEYRWEGQALGGRREAVAQSPHRALAEPFRAYADHMGSTEYREAVERVLELAHDHRLALMCAEALPETCHRLLIADDLTRRGHRLVHILRDGASRTHESSSSARWDGERLIYDRGTQGELI